MSKHDATAPKAPFKVVSMDGARQRFEPTAICQRFDVEVAPSSITQILELEILHEPLRSGEGPQAFPKVRLKGFFRPK